MTLSIEFEVSFSYERGVIVPTYFINGDDPRRQQRIDAFVDTGAKHTLLRRHVIAGLGLPRSEFSNELIDASGSKSRSSVFTCVVAWEQDRSSASGPHSKRQIKLDILEVDQLPGMPATVAAILGRDFFWHGAVSMVPDTNHLTGTFKCTF